MLITDFGKQGRRQGLLLLNVELVPGAGAAAPVASIKHLVVAGSGRCN